MQTPATLMKRQSAKHQFGLKMIGLLLLAVCAMPSAYCQNLVWDVDFQSMIENREGGDELRPDQTIIFTRLNPEIGLQIKEGSSSHFLMAGASWYQPINNECTDYKIVPTIYYKWQQAETKKSKSGWQVAVGFIPRRELVEAAPRYLWSDSMSYVQPVVRGVLAQYRSKQGSYAEAMVDWRQMQTTTRREAFNAVLNGKQRFGSHFWVGGYLQYNHLAKRKNVPETEEGVNDDLTINPMVGADWRLAPGKSLGVKAGAIINMQRARADQDGWKSPCGVTATLNGRFRWLEVEESVYAGEDLFPLWERFGSQLNLGDTYYRSKFYSRTDVRAHIVQNKYVDLSATLTYHATDKITGFWQQISCRFFFGQAVNKLKRKK